MLKKIALKKNKKKIFFKNRLWLFGQLCLRLHSKTLLKSNDLVQHLSSTVKNPALSRDNYKRGHRLNKGDACAKMERPLKVKLRLLYCCCTQRERSGVSAGKVYVALQIQVHFVHLYLQYEAVYVFGNNLRTGVSYKTCE